MTEYHDKAHRAMLAARSQSLHERQTPGTDPVGSTELSTNAALSTTLLRLPCSSVTHLFAPAAPVEMLARRSTFDTGASDGARAPRVALSSRLECECGEEDRGPEDSVIRAPRDPTRLATTPRRQARCFLQHPLASAPYCFRVLAYYHSNSKCLQ